MRRLACAVLAAASLLAQPAHADNPMGYRLLPANEAAQLPRNQGTLGADVERARRISEDGMSFDVMRVTKIRPGSAAARAGLRLGDQIIALNGFVFPDLDSFAAYIGSRTRGSRVTLDYMPGGAGPAQAQRIDVVLD